MKQEINEVAVELNSIFDNMSQDILNKIPLKIRNFFKNNASSTYSFEYDKTKSLNEQNIKDKTRGIIALLYRDYICDEAERKEYNDIYSKFLIKKEEEKRDLYNPNNIFKKADNKNYNYENKNTNYLEKYSKKQSFIKKFFDKILKLFKNK